MVDQRFKVLEEDVVLVGVPIVPLDPVPGLLAAQLSSTDDRIADLESRVAKLEEEIKPA